MRQLPGETDPAPPLHGLALWTLIGGLMLGVYLVGLDMTLLATVTPTLTDYFRTVSDVSWYETAYVLMVCVFIPVAGKAYSVFPNKYVYLVSMVIFQIGSLICALARSSGVFILGRTINGLGSTGLLSGALLIIHTTCLRSIRPVVTSSAMALISVGATTGPQIAGALTDHAGWRWCFWIFLPIGGATMLATLFIRIPEQTKKLPFAKATVDIPRLLDPVGFAVFAGAIVMLILAITWGGSESAWSSAIVIGLLCGSFGAAVAFACWIFRRGDAALVPASCLRHRSVSFGGGVMLLQGGCTQMISYYLPFWFQVVRGDTPTQSAVHILPSLLSNILALITFGALVRKFSYIPPWGIAGSMLCTIGSGLLSTINPKTSMARLVGYQIVTNIGRGMAFQVPVIAAQEEIPSKDSASALAVVNLLMSLGSSVGISSGQTIFRNSLPPLLREYAPGVDPGSIVNAGATEIRDLVEPSQLDGLVVAYSEALVRMFYFPVACGVIAFFLSFGLGWSPVKKNETEKI
ncbi:major facilitator superfamily domain-containing protein [Aspergillus pseudoustus]|uniref:Major facilitator superfamily domain-containing protein n=1 Tax=Aspergillus pseudoustus TaxID=1810923 RepID=A0ABR4JVV3_9EURO